MKKIQVSDFQTGMDLYNFFLRRFSDENSRKGPFWGYPDPNGDFFLKKITLFVDLLKTNELQIKEHEYIFSYIDDDRLEESGLWNKLRNSFRNSGSYITPLRKTVISFLEASDTYSSESCDFRVIEKNSLYSEKQRVIIALGYLTYNELFDYFISRPNSVDHVLYFPYLGQGSENILNLFDAELYYEISLNSSGLAKYDQMMTEYLDNALNNTLLIL